MEDRESLSANHRMDQAQSAIEVAVSIGKKPEDVESPYRQKSYAEKDYSKVQAHENGNVEHPYDKDCPYCHNLSQTDMVAMRQKMRTEQSMKES